MEENQANLEFFNMLYEICSCSTNNIKGGNNMQISEKDLELMIKIENLLGHFRYKMFGRKLNKTIKMRLYGEDITFTEDDCWAYWSLIERLIHEKEVK